MHTTSTPSPNLYRSPASQSGVIAESLFCSMCTEPSTPFPSHVFFDALKMLPWHADRSRLADFSSGCLARLHLHVDATSVVVRFMNVIVIMPFYSRVVRSASFAAG